MTLQMSCIQNTKWGAIHFEVALYTITAQRSRQWTSSRSHANVKRLENSSCKNYSTAKSASARNRVCGTQPISVNSLTNDNYVFSSLHKA